MEQPRSQKYYKSHKDKISEYNKKYKSEHRSKSAEYQREYMKRHHDARIAIQIARNVENKARLVMMHGGKCAVCGYENSLAALDFHHAEQRTTRIVRTTKEASKCVLLCANCHREHHNGGIEYQEVI